MSEDWMDTIIPPSRELEPWFKDYMDARVAEGATEITLSQEDFEVLMKSCPRRYGPPADPETLLRGPMVLTWNAVPVRWSRAAQPIRGGVARCTHDPSLVCLRCRDIDHPDHTDAKVRR